MAWVGRLSAGPLVRVGSALSTGKSPGLGQGQSLGPDQEVLGCRRSARDPSVCRNRSHQGPCQSPSPCGTSLGWSLRNLGEKRTSQPPRPMRQTPAPRTRIFFLGERTPFPSPVGPEFCLQLHHQCGAGPGRCGARGDGEPSPGTRLSCGTPRVSLHRVGGQRPCTRGLAALQGRQTRRCLSEPRGKRCRGEGIRAGPGQRRGYQRSNREPWRSCPRRPYRLHRFPRGALGARRRQHWAGAGQGASRLPSPAPGAVGSVTRAADLPCKTGPNCPAVFCA